MAFSSSIATGPVEVFPGFVLVPTGGLTHYVHASGASALDLLPAGMQAPSPGGFFTSVASALGSCRANRGDRVVCLPGHTESIAAADAWANSLAGVSVIGVGEGDNRPTFTWTAATATILFDQANFGIRNCNLYMAGDTASTTALTVAAPITVSAAGCFISDCYINFGVDADQLVTIGVTTTAAGDRFRFNRNKCWGATAAECTSFFYAVGADHLQIHDTVIAGGTSSTTVGVLRFITTASLGIDIRRSIFQNLKAASIHAVTQMDGVLGTVADCGFGILDNATLAGWVPASAGNGPQLFNCRTANLAAENGGVTTPVSA
jgi:hypothetical protein